MLQKWQEIALAITAASLPVLFGAGAAFILWRIM